MWITCSQLVETEEGKRENRCRLEEDEERVHVQKPRSRKLIKIIQEIRLNAPREPAEPECFPFRLEPALTSAPAGLHVTQTRVPSNEIRVCALLPASLQTLSFIM